MKKLFIALLLVCVSFFSFSQDLAVETVKKQVVTHAQSTTDKILDGTRTDVRDVIGGLHSDVTTALSTVYSDAKGVISQAYADVHQAVGYLAPKLEAGLVALSQALKTTVAEVFKALVMKQIAISASYLGIGILSFIFLFISYRIISKPKEELYNEEPNSNGSFTWKLKWIVTLLLTAPAGIGLFINFLVNFQTMMLGFIAPKAGAIQELVNIVTQLFK